MRLHVLFSAIAIAKTSKNALNKREKNIEIKTRKFRVQPTDQCKLNSETVHWQTDSSIKHLVTYPLEYSAGWNNHYGIVTIKTDDFLETWNSNTNNPVFYASTVLKNFPEFFLGFHAIFEKLKVTGYLENRWHLIIKTNRKTSNHKLSHTVDYVGVNTNTTSKKQSQTSTFFKQSYYQHFMDVSHKKRVFRIRNLKSGGNTEIPRNPTTSSSEHNMPLFFSGDDDFDPNLFQYFLCAEKRVSYFNLIKDWNKLKRVQKWNFIFFSNSVHSNSFHFVKQCVAIQEIF